MKKIIETRLSLIALLKEEIIVKNVVLIISHLMDKIILLVLLEAIKMVLKKLFKAILMEQWQSNKLRIRKPTFGHLVKIKKVN